MKLFHNWKAMAMLVASTMVVGSVPINASNTESAGAGIQNFSEEQVGVDTEIDNEEVLQVEETQPEEQETQPEEQEIQPEAVQEEASTECEPECQPQIFTKAHTIITMPQQEFVYDGTPKGEIELSCDNPDCTAEFTGKCTITVNKIGELSGITHEWPTDAGRYHVVVNYYGDDNHHFEWESFEFVIKKANVTITADDKSKEYSDEDPELTYSVTSEGQLEDTSFLDGKVAIYREAGEDVGVYPIYVEWNGSCSTNYNVITVDGSFEITRKVLVFDPIYASKVYGDEDPELTWMILDGEGDVYENQNIADDWYQVVREAGENVGVYTTIMETIGNPDEKNYELVLKEGSFEIVPKDITVTIDNKEKYVGDKDPEFTYKVFGEDNEAIDVALKLEREAGEEVGKYEIYVGDADINENYNMTVTNGILEIKESQKSEDPTKPDDTKKPEKPAKPENNQTTNNKTNTTNATTNTTTNTTSPKTADETPVLPFASTAVVALGAIVIFLRKTLKKI